MDSEIHMLSQEVIIASGSLIAWGMVLHYLIDWPFQNSWIAAHKTNWTHQSAYIHALAHGAIQLLVFPWWAALIIGITHFIIDLRWVVDRWSKLIRQIQPVEESPEVYAPGGKRPEVPAMPVDIGQNIRIWNDQTWHIAVIALMALMVTLT
jgi:hypothetical protein